MAKKYKVLLSPCRKGGAHGWVTSDTIEMEVVENGFGGNKSCRSAEDLLSRMQAFCLVRPMFNDERTDGRMSFREWRSFDGEPLQEIYFEA